jgi:hypothetical protein
MTLKQRVESLESELNKRDSEIESLRRELKVTAEFYELWKRIAQSHEPVIVPLINPVYPYPQPIGPIWSNYGTGIPLPPC